MVGCWWTEGLGGFRGSTAPPMPWGGPPWTAPDACVRHWPDRGVGPRAEGAQCHFVFPNLNILATCRAGWHPGWHPARRLLTGAVLAGFQVLLGGLPTRRRLTTCPTTRAEFPFCEKQSGTALVGQAFSLPD